MIYNKLNYLEFLRQSLSREIFLIKIILLLSFCTGINLQAQSYPDLDFSIPSEYQFKVDSVSYGSSGIAKTILTSRSKSVASKNLLQIHHLDLNLNSLSEEEYFYNLQEEYRSQGMRSKIAEANGRSFLIVGMITDIKELDGEQNYMMIANTFHKGDSYIITVMSVIQDQTDWVFRVMDEIEFY